MPELPPVYLDHNATTPLCAAARDAMMACFTEAFGNPSNMHWAGRAARRHVDAGRRGIAALCSARTDHVVITSGGTEADNMALRSALAGERRHVVATPLEHPAVLAPLRALDAAGAIELELLTVDRHGQIDLDDLAGKLRDDTALVCVMAAHNELGTVYPVVEAAGLAHDAGARFHCDAVQAAGKIDLAPIGAVVDSLAMSGHKLYGPKGVGALVVRDRAWLEPLILGGGQEGGLRSGTENVSGIAGFGAAAQVALEDLADAPRLGRLREMLHDGLVSVAGERIERNSPREGCLPNTLHVSVRGMDASAMLAELNRDGIAASSGSACHAGGGGGSSALRAIGLDGEALYGTLRFSLGRSSDEHAIERCLASFERGFASCLD